MKERNNGIAGSSEDDLDEDGCSLQMRNSIHLPRLITHKKVRGTPIREKSTVRRRPMDVHGEISP